MAVRWTRPAAQDLEGIVQRIGKDNSIAARQVAQTLYDRCMGLEMFPNRGRIGRIGRIAGTRELVFAPGLPYIAIYRVHGDEVEILRTYLSAQNWP